MNRSFFMYSAVLLLLAPFPSYLSGQDAVVSRLPENTAAFVYVNDLSSILSVFSETTFASSFEESPLGDLTKQLVEIAMESDELSELNDYILTDVEFGETLANKQPQKKTTIFEKTVDTLGPTCHHLVT